MKYTQEYKYIEHDDTSLFIVKNNDDEMLEYKLLTYGFHYLAFPFAYKLYMYDKENRTIYRCDSDDRNKISKLSEAEILAIKERYSKELKDLLGVDFDVIYPLYYIPQETESINSNYEEHKDLNCEKFKDINYDDLPF